MRQKSEQAFKEALAKLTQRDQDQFTEAVKQIVGEHAIDAALFTLKIKLEGEQFNASVPADYAHAIWKIQQSYYKLVATVLYGDPVASLTAEEREQFLLVFSIEKGSTDSEAPLWSTFAVLAERVADKMEPWHILFLAALLCLTYLGAKGIEGYFSHKDKKLVSEAENERKKIDAQQYAQSLDSHAKAVSEAFALVLGLIDKHHDAFVAAQEAGRDGRMAILKGVRGIDKAEIGERTYTSEQIAEIRRRSPRTQARSEVKNVNVTVVRVDSEDKNYPKFTLQEKISGIQYSTEISPQNYEEEDYETIMDIVWESARYPNRYFWAEASMVYRKDKLVECSILGVARTKKELMLGYDESDAENQ